ncbi:MAG: hydroxymethylbilane synthase [Blastocatellia bacterium]|nr:hydroxymethylbilane synthase [Blastocatellia bacterium]
MTRSYSIGTRGSELALWQANWVKSKLAILSPESIFEIKVIETTGDQILDVALSKIGDKGLFTRQIETELIDGRIDLAVHSLKDLQTVQPDGLVIGAMCERDIPNDAFVSQLFHSVDELPRGARVATGSLRRKSQLLNYRPDLEIVDIRGNVPTRLAKFADSDLDGLVLAYAGLSRLGYREKIRQTIPFDVMLPAPGQGSIAVEARSDDDFAMTLCGRLDDASTRLCIMAERSFLRHLEGGCQVPIGAIATLRHRTVHLEGMVGSLDGVTVLREHLECDISESDSLGVRLAESLIEKGAADLLATNREQI